MAALPLALQLYTVRDETAKDFTGTLRQVAAKGYTAVEFAGYGGLEAAELKALLDELGLRAASTHIPLAALQQDAAAQISYCTTIGCQNLVLPWLEPALRDAASILGLAPFLNEVGQQCQAQGIGFAYHNHDFEYVQSEGRYLLDQLLAATDPAAVSLELDLYWTAYAGLDPASYLRENLSRVRLLHLKDMAADRSFTEVGDGSLDWPTIFNVAQGGEVRWYIVENDRPAIPSLESAARSLQNLKAMGK